MLEKKKSWILVLSVFFFFFFKLNTKIVFDGKNGSLLLVSSFAWFRLTNNYILSVQIVLQTFTFNLNVIHLISHFFLLLWRIAGGRLDSVNSTMNRSKMWWYTWWWHKFSVSASIDVFFQYFSCHRILNTFTYRCKRINKSKMKIIENLYL